MQNGIAKRVSGLGRKERRARVVRCANREVEKGKNEPRSPQTKKPQKPKSIALQIKYSSTRLAAFDDNRCNLPEPIDIGGQELRPSFSPHCWIAVIFYTVRQPNYADVFGLMLGSFAIEPHDRPAQLTSSGCIWK